MRGPARTRSRRVRLARALGPVARRLEPPHADRVIEGHRTPRPRPSRSAPPFASHRTLASHRLFASVHRRTTHPDDCVRPLGFRAYASGPGRIFAPRRKTVCLRPRCDANLSRFVPSVPRLRSPLRAPGTSCRFKTFRIPTRVCPTHARVPGSCVWLGRNQLGGQFKALAWGLLHFVSVSALPFCVGFAVQAVVDRSGARLALAGGLIVLCGVGHRAGRHHAAPGRGHQLDHRRRTRPAAAGPQDRPAGLRADPAGRGRRGRRRLHRRRREDRLVRRGRCRGSRRPRSPSCWSASAWSSTSRRSASSSPWACPSWRSPCCRCCPAPPGAPTSSARRRAAPPSWPRTPSRACGCCAASAARNCSSTATAAPRRRSATRPCAVPGCGR